MTVVLVFREKYSFEDGFEVKTFDSENDLQQWLIKNWDNVEPNTVSCWAHCREAHYIPHLLVKGET